ncbi:MAG: DsbA family protein, partial [Gammaproteobacteria bacterium]
FVEAGVDGNAFDKTFDSFAVQQKMSMADKLFKSYQLKHVPVFVVGGQYVTDVSMAGSGDAVVDVIEYLTRKIKISQSAKEQGAS